MKKKLAILCTAALVAASFCTPVFAGNYSNTSGTVTLENVGSHTDVAAIGAQVVGSFDNNTATATNVSAFNGADGAPSDYAGVAAVGAQVSNVGSSNQALNIGDVTATNTAAGWNAAHITTVTAIGAQVSGSYGATSNWIGDQNATYGNIAKNSSLVSANNAGGNGATVVAAGAGVVNSGFGNSANSTFGWVKANNAAGGTNEVYATGAYIDGSRNGNVASAGANDLTVVSTWSSGATGNSVAGTGAIVQNSLDYNTAIGNGPIWVNLGGSYNQTDNEVVGTSAQVIGSGSYNTATHSGGWLTATSDGSHNTVNVIGASISGSGNWNQAICSGLVSGTSVGSHNTVTVIGAQVQNSH